MVALLPSAQLLFGDCLIISTIMVSIIFLDYITRVVAVDIILTNVQLGIFFVSVLPFCSFFTAIFLTQRHKLFGYWIFAVLHLFFPLLV